MTRTDPLVVFTPSGKRGRFPVGTPLLTAARQLGVDIDSVCGGRAICGRCQVLVAEGEFAKHGVRSSAASLSPFSETETRYGTRKVLAVTIGIAMYNTPSNVDTSLQYLQRWVHFAIVAPGGSFCKLVEKLEKVIDWSRSIAMTKIAAVMTHNNARCLLLLVFACVSVVIKTDSLASIVVADHTSLGTLVFRNKCQAPVEKLRSSTGKKMTNVLHRGRIRVSL